MNELTRFHDELVEVYGYSVQVDAGIAAWNKQLTNAVAAGKTCLASPLSFGADHPSSPDARYQYRRTVGELIEASAPNGSDATIHRRSVVVLIISAWEDEYRGRIANELSIEKNDLKSDVLYDLNQYRRAIIHADGKLLGNPRVLDILGKGDPISLTKDDMNRIFRMLIDELNRMSAEVYGIDSQFSLDKRWCNP